jgi:hypothetical protein
VEEGNCEKRKAEELICKFLKLQVPTVPPEMYLSAEQSLQIFFFKTFVDIYLTKLNLVENILILCPKQSGHNYCYYYYYYYRTTVNLSTL